MEKKEIQMLDQLNNGYHLEDNDIEYLTVLLNEYTFKLNQRKKELGYIPLNG